MTSGALLTWLAGATAPPIAMSGVVGKVSLSKYLLRGHIVE
jgi:hypothetical protein